MANSGKFEDGKVNITKSSQYIHLYKITVK